MGVETIIQYIAYGVTLLTFISLITDRITPIRNFKNRIMKLEERVDRHERINERDMERFKSAEQTDLFILKSVVALLNHLIDGEHIENVKAVRDDIMEYVYGKEGMKQ